jgi:hypothetical protein
MQIAKPTFLSQTDLRARSHERMSALSTAASRVPKSSVTLPLASKRVIQWKITSAVVACLSFGVKAETLIDVPRAWPDRGQSIPIITAPLFLGNRRSKQFSEEVKMRDTQCDQPSANAFIIPDVPHI